MKTHARLPPGYGCALVPFLFWFATWMWLRFVDSTDLAALVGLALLSLLASAAAAVCVYRFPTLPDQGARRRVIALCVGVLTLPFWYFSGIALAWIFSLAAA